MTKLLLGFLNLGFCGIIIIQLHIYNLIGDRKEGKKEIMKLFKYFRFAIVTVNANLRLNKTDNCCVVYLFNIESILFDYYN